MSDHEDAEATTQAQADLAKRELEVKRERVRRETRLKETLTGIRFCEDPELDDMLEAELDEMEFILGQTHQVRTRLERIASSVSTNPRRSLAVRQALDKVIEANLPGSAAAPLVTSSSVPDLTALGSTPVRPGRTKDRRKGTPRTTSPADLGAIGGMPQYRQVGRKRISVAELQQHYDAVHNLADLSEESLTALQSLVNEHCPYDPRDFSVFTVTQMEVVQNWYLDKIQQLSLATKGMKKGGEVQDSPPSYFDNTPKTIKPFSGTSPVPNGELTHCRWRRAVTALDMDRSLKPEVKKRIVLKSIVGKAEDVIQSILEQPLKAIVETIDCTYGVIRSVDEMKSEFLSHQQGDEFTFDYFVDLYIEAQEIEQEGGYHDEILTEEVVKQFCSGVKDEELLLTKLNWESQLEAGSLSTLFPELATRLRKEIKRMEGRKKRHQPKEMKPSTSEGVRKKDIVGKQQSLTAEELVNPLAQQLNRLQELVEKQVKISEHVSKPEYTQEVYEEALSGQQRFKTDRKPRFDPNSQKPKPFCYRCGLDNHFCDQCDNAKNPELVRQKRLERQAAWNKLKSKQQDSEN